MSRIGLIGLGNVGGAVANNLRRKGYEISCAFDLNQNLIKNLNLPEAKSPAEVGDRSDVIITSLPKPEHVRIALEGKNGLFETIKPKSTWIDHSTTDYHQTLRLYKRGNELGISTLEAPITGGMQLLQQGKMCCFIGGPKETYENCKPILDASFPTQFYMGEIGSATITKVISNMLAAAHTVVTSEAIMLAKKSGVEDLEMFFQAIRKSAGNSYVFETEAPLIFNGTYDPHFTVDLQCKDLRLGYELAQANGVPLKVLGLAEQIYNEAKVKYGAESGSSIPAKLIEDNCDVKNQIPGYDDFVYTIEDHKNSWSVHHTHK